MTDTQRSELRQLAKEGRVPMPNTIIELIDEVTALQAQCEKWKREAETAWQGQEAGSEWRETSRDYMTIDFLEDEIEVLEP